VRIFVQMPVVLIFAMLGIVRAVHRRPRLQVLRETWALAALLGIAATLAAWARPGGASNNLLTTYLFAIPPALRELRCWSRRARPSFRTAPLSLLAAQFAVLLYDPRAQIPTSAEVQQARAFIDRLSSIAGPVLVPEHPWYAILAGKEPSYHSCALWELQRTLGQDRWPDDLRARLAAGYYRAVFTAWSTDAPDLGSYPPELATRYRVTDRLTFQGRELDALSGKRGTRPSLAYAPATGAF
jgi:hypothetical protein